MAYKMVDELEKLCGRVAGAAMEHRALITQVVTERFRHKLPEGQTIPDILQLQTWIAEELHESHADVLASESGLKAELTVDRQDREQRGRYGIELRQHLFAARNVFDAIYGAGGSDVMFNETNMQVRIDPVPLYRQGVTVHDNILNPDFRRPPVRFQIEVNLEQLARGMEPSLEGLRSTLDVLHSGTQASNALLAVKDTQMGILDQRTGLAARLLEAFYNWAEEQGLARRVRLSSHRGSGVAALPATTEGAEASADPSPAGETAAGETPAGETPAGETPAGASADPPQRAPLTASGHRTRPPVTSEGD